MIGSTPYPKAPDDEEQRPQRKQQGQEALPRQPPPPPGVGGPLPGPHQEEDAQLERSILQDGIAVPLHADEGGRVIDGCRRLRVAKKHGITRLDVVVHVGLTADQKRQLAISLNFYRRQNGHRRCLSAAQKKGLIEAELLRQYQDHALGGPAPLTDRTVGKMFSVSKNTVAAARKGLVAGGQIDHLDKLQASDGKRYRTTRIITPLREAKKLMSALSEVNGERLPEQATFKSVSRARWKPQQRRLIEAGTGQADPPNFTFYAQDFRTVDWPEGFADLVFTDPPWAKWASTATWAGSPPGC